MAEIEGQTNAMARISVLHPLALEILCGAERGDENLCLGR
jgi:hypothetical protein